MDNRAWKVLPKLFLEMKWANCFRWPDPSKDFQPAPLSDDIQDFVSQMLLWTDLRATSEINVDHSIAKALRDFLHEKDQIIVER